MAQAPAAHTYLVDVEKPAEESIVLLTQLVHALVLVVRVALRSSYLLLQVVLTRLVVDNGTHLTQVLLQVGKVLIAHK